MRNIMLRYLAKTTFIFLSISIAGICSNHVQAQTDNETLNQIEQYTIEGKEDSIEQITNVNQLKDVSPTDWSYEALRSLSDRYGCVSGLPDGTYQGDRPITRNEFAAGLNSCFQQIERSIKSQKLPSLMSVFLGQTKVFTEEDGSITTITAEGNEFESELATVGGNTDDVESRIIKLEDNQFSATTKLTGETIFSVSDTFNGF